MTSHGKSAQAGTATASTASTHRSHMLDTRAAIPVKAADQSRNESVTAAKSTKNVIGGVLCISEGRSRSHAITPVHDAIGFTWCENMSSWTWHGLFFKES